jgi:hypothetical protein
MLLIHWINFYHRTFKNKAIGKELPHPGANVIKQYCGKLPH